MKPFQPVGRQARTKYVIEWAVAAEVGDIVSYDTLAELMELQCRSAAQARATVQQTVFRALPLMERDHARTLEVVRGFGYRVADALGHLRLGHGHRRKAGRSLRRGHSKVESVDLAKVEDPEVVRRIETARVVLDGQLEAARRAAAKLRREERLLGRLPRASG